MSGRTRDLAEVKKEVLTKCGRILTKTEEALVSVALRKARLSDYMELTVKKVDGELVRVSMGNCVASISRLDGSYRLKITPTTDRSIELMEGIVLDIMVKNYGDLHILTPKDLLEGQLPMDKDKTVELLLEYVCDFVTDDEVFLKHFKEAAKECDLESAAPFDTIQDEVWEVLGHKGEAVREELQEVDVTIVRSGANIKYWVSRALAKLRARL